MPRILAATLVALAMISGAGSTWLRISELARLMAVHVAEEIGPVPHRHARGAEGLQRGEARAPDRLDLGDGLGRQPERGPLLGQRIERDESRDDEGSSLPS